MTIRQRSLLICIVFSTLLIFTGSLRLLNQTESALSQWAALSTPLYIVATVAAAITLTRNHVQFNRLGFGFAWRWRYLWLATIGVIILQASGQLLAPFWDLLFGAPRDLDRFATVEGSLTNALTLIVFSWTFAAFGEELTFRILLQGGLQSAFGKSRIAILSALTIQAIIFGTVHMYQGPTGMVSATISGLILGALTVKAKGAIWPAALAHGLSNTIGIGSLYLGLS